MLGLKTLGRVLCIAAPAALLVSLGGAPAADATTYHGCVNKKGALRILSAHAKCKHGEKKITLNSEGVPGKNGTNGTNGINGINGTNGTNGMTGFTSVLPTGATEEGTWATASPKSTLAYGAISFVIPLAATATINVIDAGGSSTTACPGTPAKPAATHGNLCIYTAKELNVELRGVFNPDISGGESNVGRFGVVVFVIASAAGEGVAYGTWAVTG